MIATVAEYRKIATGGAYHRSHGPPLRPPLEPMLAKPTPEIPTGDGWAYEPKWDGFRAIAFRDGPSVYLQSRDLKPLNRYFPELEAPLLALVVPTLASSPTARS